LQAASGGATPYRSNTSHRGNRLARRDPVSYFPAIVTHAGWIMKRLSLSAGSLLCVLALTGCATSPTPDGNRLSADDAFSQQVILVTVAPGLNADFVVDTRKLAQIPGVVSLRIATPVEFGPGHQNPDWWIGDYDYAIFIEFENENVTDSYGANPIHEAWGKKWGVKELPTFRALRATGPVAK
jgi:hypothetical protein